MSAVAPVPPVGRKVPWWTVAWIELRALALPLGAWWAAMLLCVGLFSGFVLGFEGLSNENQTILPAFDLVAIGGVAFGQLLALARLRAAVVVGVLGAAWAVVLVGFSAQLAASDTALAANVGVLGNIVFMTFALALLVGPIFVACGHFSLTTHLGLLATFAPVVFLVGTIFEISSQTGSVERWYAGQKWAIWNLMSAPVLTVGVLALLAYLAAREVHRLHRWRTATGGPDLVATPPPKGVARAKTSPGCGGVLLLVVLGLALTLSTALVAPYLWRTGPGDRQGDAGATTSGAHTQDGGHRDHTSWSAGDPDQGDGIDFQQLAKEAEQAARQAVFSLLMLLLMLTLLLVGLLVFGPPLRRALLLQHLRRPLWPVPPTRRVEQHWRVVEIALGDIGLHREPGDSALSLARRVRESKLLLDPALIEQCANVVDRVVYGLGVLPEDTMLARRTAEMTYQAVWDELSERRKIAAMYRFL